MGGGCSQHVIFDDLLPLNSSLYPILSLLIVCLFSSFNSPHFSVLLLPSFLRLYVTLPLLSLSLPYSFFFYSHSLSLTLSFALIFSLLSLPLTLSIALTYFP